MFFAYIGSKIDYTVPAWQPWLSNTNMTWMENFQSRALCIATSQILSTPAKALRMEASVPSYTTTSNRNVLTAKEISLRSSVDHPKNIALNVKIPQWLLTRSSWWRKANKLSDTLNYRQQTEFFSIASWHRNAPNSYNTCCSVPGIKSHTNNISLKTGRSTKQIHNHHTYYITYTDGSAMLGSKDDSFAVVIT